MRLERPLSYCLEVVQVQPCLLATTVVSAIFVEMTNGVNTGGRGEIVGHL